MVAGANDNGIYLFDYQFRKMLPAIKSRISNSTKEDFTEGDHPLHKDLEAQVTEYFDGTRTVFTLPIIFSGTAFQQKVWKGLLDISYGRISTYKQQAIGLEMETAIRAIASANGANGLAIIIPCHRVVGANNSLTGYSGGLASKRWLLNHENNFANNPNQFLLF